MTQVIIRQRKGSKRKSQNKHKVEMLSGVVVPKSFLLIFHNQQNNKLLIKHQSVVNCEDCQPPNNMVTAINLSELAAYFVFLPPDERLEAYTQLISLISKVGQESVSSFTGHLMPTSLKQFYLRTIQFYRSLPTGCAIVTEVFISKLSKLVVSIWRHGQIYLDFFRRQPPAPTVNSGFAQLATSYLC